MAATNNTKKLNKSIVPRRNPPRKCKRPRDGNGTLASTRNTKRRISASFPNLYFDKIPIESVEHILRFASDRPNENHWQDFVDPGDVLAVLKSGGALSTCAHQMFDRIEANDKIPKVRNGLLVAGKGGASRTQFPKVINSLSDVVTEIRVSRPTFPSLWRKSLMSRLPKLKKLTISMPERSARVPLGDILGAHSGQLEALELSWKILDRAEVKAIQAHCKGLRSLTLNFRCVTAKLTPIWGAVGPTLEKIAIATVIPHYHMDARHERSAELLFDNMAAIGSSCIALRNLDFTAVPIKWHEDLTKLCEGYGDQLQRLTLNHCNIDAASALRIREACSNVVFDVFDGSGTLAPVLISMGPKLSHVALGPRTFQDFDIVIDDKWKAVSEKCKNLESILLVQSYHQFQVPDLVFDILLSSPKKHLKVVKMHNIRIGTQEKFLKALGTYVDTLEDIEILGEIPLLEPLQEFANATPSLRTVTLCGLPGTRKMCQCVQVDGTVATGGVPKLDEKYNWMFVIEVFLECPKLVKIDFSCTRYPHQRLVQRKVAQFADALYPARRRGISARICSCQYT